MNKILVAIFENESKAYEGQRILRQLDAEGSIETFATAVLAKDSTGNVTVKQEDDEGPVGTAVGLLTGSLLGLLAGPVGLVVAAGAGTLGGAIYDLANVGIGADFLDEVGRELQPGKSAVVADVWEEWVTPVDARIEAAGGMVLRRGREEVVDAQIEREAAALKAETASLKAERAQAKAERKAKLEGKIEATRAKLRATQERARAALAAVKEEAEAKIKKLEAKAAKAHGERKAKLDARIAETRADLGRRSERLHRARELTKEALEV